MPDPKYKQIAEELRGEIESGTIGHDGRLPTEIELMERFSASRNTVRDAVRLLATRGLIETRPGQGTFVVAKVAPFVTTLTRSPQAGNEGSVYTREIKASGRRPTSSAPRVEIQGADATLADALGIAVGDSVVSRHQQRFIDNVAWSLQTTFYAMTLATERGAGRLLQPEDIPEGTAAYLAKACSIKQVGYRDLIAVRVANPHEISFFRLSADRREPVFEISRVAYDGDGRPIRLTITVYPADRNHFQVNVGKVPVRDGDGDGDGP